MKEYERADVVQFAKENNEGLSFEALTSLAEECGIGNFSTLIDFATLCEPDEQLSNVLHGQGEVPTDKEGEGESSEQNTDQPMHAI